jgi:hypothetical protein
MAVCSGQARAVLHPRTNWAADSGAGGDPNARVVPNVDCMAMDGPRGATEITAPLCCC